ncbi:MAG: aldehyde dehydrogenase [Vampirovibrio sp.]
MVAVSSEHSSFSKYNPSTGALLVQVPVSSAHEIEQGLNRAKIAQIQWALVPVKQRVEVLKKVEYLIHAEAEHLIYAISQEVGKPLAEALQADILSALAGIQHLIHHAQQFNPQIKWSLKGLALGKVFKQVPTPYGVVSVISPWNYPIGTPAPAIANALLAGNAVAFKPSEKTPTCGTFLARLFQEALMAHGFSTDLIQLFQGDARVGDALVKAPETAFVFFTGSEAVGRSIQITCATRNIPCSLELGGSDAMVILPSAERYSLDAVVSHALLGRFANAGQTCAAIKHLYIPNTLRPIIQELLTAKLSQLRVGDPFLPSTHMGPVVDVAQKQKILAQWQDALAQGAEPIYGQSPHGEASLEHSAFLTPLIVFNPPKHSKIVEEEVFGPILPVWTYDDLSQVVDALNDSPYGLGVSIFGKPKQAEWLGKQINVANVAINDLHMMFYTFPHIEWRGFKQTGPGCRNGAMGIMQFSQIKTFGKAFCFDWLPFTQKPVYLFPQGDRQLKDYKTLLETVGTGKFWHWLKPSLLRFMWENKGNTKL